MLQWIGSAEDGHWEYNSGARLSCTALSSSVALLQALCAAHSLQLCVSVASCSVTEYACMLQSLPLRTIHLHKCTQPSPAESGSAEPSLQADRHSPSDCTLKAAAACRQLPVVQGGLGGLPADRWDALPHAGGAPLTPSCFALDPCVKGEQCEPAGQKWQHCCGLWKVL